MVLGGRAFLTRFFVAKVSADRRICVLGHATSRYGIVCRKVMQHGSVTPSSETRVVRHLGRIDCVAFRIASDGCVGSDVKK